MASCLHGLLITGSKGSLGHHPDRFFRAVLLGWPVGHFPAAWLPQAAAEHSSLGLGPVLPRQLIELAKTGVSLFVSLSLLNKNVPNTCWVLSQVLSIRFLAKGRWGGALLREANFLLEAEGGAGQ